MKKLLNHWKDKLVEGKILKKHLQECVKESLTGNNFETTVAEIIKILKR